MPYSPNSPMPTDTITLAKWICEVLFLEPSQHQSFFESVLSNHSTNKSTSRIDPAWPIVPHLPHLSHIFDMRELLAYCLASTLLDGIEDKQGRPLIEHCFRVYLACRHLSPDQRIAALLHDCVEDGHLPHFYEAAEHDHEKHAIQYLIRLFFGFKVDELIISLSRNTYPKERTYVEYIRHVANYADAISIKLADLRDNLDPTRGSIPDSLRQRYEEAVKVLEAAQERYESLNAASKAVNSFGTSSKDLERSLADIEETKMFKRVYEYTMSDSPHLITEQEAALDSYSLSSLAEIEPPPNTDLDFDPTYSAECDMVWIGDDFWELG